MKPVLIPVELDKGEPKPMVWRRLAANFRELGHGSFVLRLEKPEVTRSVRQNAAFHAMLTPWANAEGHDIEDLKDDLLRAVFGEREVVDVVTGEVRKVLAEPHTSKLSKEKFAHLMERSAQIAAECGYRLELPGEFRERQLQEMAGR